MKSILIAAAAALFMTAAQAQTTTFLEVDIEVDLSDDALVTAYQSNDIDASLTVVDDLANLAIGSTITVDDLDTMGVNVVDIDVEVELADDYRVNATQLNYISAPTNIGGNLSNASVGSNVEVVGDEATFVGESNVQVDVEMYDTTEVYAYQRNSVSAYTTVTGAIENAAIGSNIGISNLDGDEGGYTEVDVTLADESEVYSMQLNDINSTLNAGSITNAAIGSAISVDFD